MKTMHSLMTFGECAAGHKLRFVTNEKKRRKVANLLMGKPFRD
ncbi:hypothetical protein PVOR_07435 [Paenibacillus vortex V453]|uniref:Uncharacterized protein n=1 Tax=Paenibacillus vortex V453 TaxID=715225 RepID=A0A2R9SZ64_9BACL|nr:hypothetical protein PVOR_07435 [Paenibacillus vortex V453]